MCVTITPATGWLMYYGKKVDTYNNLQTKMHIFSYMGICSLSNKISPPSSPCILWSSSAKWLVISTTRYVVSCLSVFAHAISNTWIAHLIKPEENCVCVYPSKLWLDITTSVELCTWGNHFLVGTTTILSTYLNYYTFTMLQEFINVFLL
jgi:hypothetical protein